MHNHVYYLAMGASENTFKAASLFLLFFGMHLQHCRCAAAVSGKDH